MTDDAELRARIEAQVAARRADAASPDADEAPDTHADATAGASTSGRGGKGLAPTRPWQRRGAGDDAGSAPNAPVVEDDAGSASTRRGGVGPARPWAGRSSNASTAKSEPAASVEAVEDDDSAGGPLRPARPWKARPAAEAARAETGTVAPAPSHPHVVLHAIGEEDSENVPAPPPPRVRGLLQRGAGKRRSDDDRRETARADEDEQRTAARDLARRRAEAEQRLAEERAEAERKLTEERAAAERELAERRAAAERQLAEQRAEAERLHAEHRAEAERLRAEQQAEAERLRAEREEAERQLAEQRAEAERRRAEEERQLAEQRAEAERQLAAQREEAERQLAEQRAEAERVRAEREEAERVLAERRAAMEELPETTAVYVPDAEAVSAFAEVAGPLQDHPVDEVDEDAQPTGRRPRRRRKGKDTIIAAPPAVAAASETTEDVPEPVVAAEVDAPAAELAPAAAIADEPTVDEPDESAAESYPWQQKDEVDLDLHGAPTWDPGQYPPEEDAPQQRRGRRALRWLLARAPEPAAEDVAAARSDDEALPETTAPATSEPEPLVDLPVAHLPVEDYLTRELPAVGEPAEEPAALVAEPAAVEARVDEAAAPVDAPPPEEAAGTETEFEPAAEVAAPVEEKPRAGSLFGRLRRRRHEELEEEPEEAFALPPVDESWLEPPKPTRDWAQRRAPIELGATPEEIESVVGEPTAAPEPATAIVPEPEPAPEPEPLAAIVPEPEPAPKPEPEPEAEPLAAIVPESEPAPEPEPEPVVRRRPAPGAPAAARRPSPGVAAAATTAGAQAAPAPRRRPSPGAAAAAAASAQPATSSGRSMPFELAGSAARAATATRPKAPDLSRFLKASEADDDEDLDDAEDTGGDDGGGGGGRARSSGDGRWRRVVTRTGVTLLIAALAAVLLRVFIVQPYYIPSASMEPTLHGCPGCNDDHVLVDKISYRVHDVRVGDIVVFHKPPNAQVSEDVLIKRVIALGGDKISMKKGRVFVNGALLEESYLNKDHSCYATDPAENFGVRTVPSGDVFVMGDNRCNSEDSREFGPIKTSSVIGRAFMIVWPLNRIRFLGS